MAKKPASQAATAPSSAFAASHTVTSASAPSHSNTQSHASSSSGSATSAARLGKTQDPIQIAVAIWKNYVQSTAQRVKLLDAFMAFLAVLAVLQFVYCVLGGNFPFNAFLSGFSATIGQFVLTASLRIQTNAENRAEFGKISDERAFADFVFGSLLLHFFCVNFVN